MDYEVPVPSLGRGCRAADKRALAGDQSKYGDDDIRRSDQSGPRAHARVDTAECVGVASRTVSKSEELAQVAERICGIEEAVLGPVSVGTRLLGGIERECDGRGVAEVH